MMSINKKIFLFCILLTVFFSLSMYLSYKSFDLKKSTIVHYKEQSDINYTASLKDNEFYEDNKLDEGYAYIASLIDKINITFNYTFNTNASSNLEFTYKIIAKLKIKSADTSSIFYEKEYVLANEKADDKINVFAYVLSKNIDVNYSYYSNLVSKFKQNYKVNTNSFLDVYLIVNVKNLEGNYYDINDKGYSLARIPLSKEEVNITLKNHNIDNIKEVATDPQIIIRKKYLLLVILFILLSIYVIYELAKTLKLRSYKSMQHIHI